MFIQTYNEKYSEEVEKVLKAEWPRVRSFTMLWHNNYYDGPIDGLLEIDGQKCKFFQIAESKAKICPKTEECDNTIDDISDTEEPACLMGQGDFDCYADWYRYYAIVPLTDAQYKEYERRQEAFEKFVGNNNTYPARNLGTYYLKPQSDWDKFYKSDYMIENNKEAINFNNSYNKIMGWFRS